MQQFVYGLLENIAFYIPLGLFLIGALLLQGIITVAAQKRNEKFQRVLMAEEAKKTAAIESQTALIERQTVALEKLAMALHANERTPQE
jgi:hypothetical protein